MRLETGALSQSFECHLLEMDSLRLSEHKCYTPEIQISFNLWPPYFASLLKNSHYPLVWSHTDAPLSLLQNFSFISLIWLLCVGSFICLFVCFVVVCLFVCLLGEGGEDSGRGLFKYNKTHSVNHSFEHYIANQQQLYSVRQRRWIVNLNNASANN